MSTGDIEHPLRPALISIPHHKLKQLRIKGVPSRRRVTWDSEHPPPPNHLRGGTPNLPHTLTLHCVLTEMASVGSGREEEDGTAVYVYLIHV